AGPPARESSGAARCDSIEARAAPLRVGGPEDEPRARPRRLGFRKYRDAVRTPRDEPRVGAGVERSVRKFQPGFSFSRPKQKGVGGNLLDLAPLSSFHDAAPTSGREAKPRGDDPDAMLARGEAGTRAAHLSGPDFFSDCIE